MYASDKAFEDEVRRIARLLWPAGEYGGALIEDGRERDGIFETEDFVHIVECTTSRSKQKAIEDHSKLDKLGRKLAGRFPQKFVKGWFITLEEPTADQREVFRKDKGKSISISFDQFRSKLVDGHSYLSARDGYPFGSLRDPESGAIQNNIDYIPLDIADETGSLLSVDDIANGLELGKHFVLLGDYGAGKSATLRQVHVSLADHFRANKTRSFPVTLNLRDHHGQVDPIEALERHARRIGFASPSALVRAWRAGLALLMLDGFDEIATAGWAGKTKRLKDLRYRSMELVRGFVRETPRGVGLLLAGRAHFFDNEAELASALGLLQLPFNRLNLSEFNDEQVALFLTRTGWTAPIPAWVPSRPLLLGYLASRGLLQETLETDAGAGPAVGWNSLLERVSAREAEIEAGIDAGTVRKLIEYIATLARNSADGLGPVSPDQITSAFSSVCGYQPDDRGAVLLQRLPGLGGHSSEDGARIFIDNDFAEAARGGAIFSYIEDPFNSNVDPEQWQSSLLPLGAQVAAYRCQRAGYSTSGKLDAALKQAGQKYSASTLAADVFLIINELGVEYDGVDFFIKEAFIPELSVDAGTKDYSSIKLKDCLVGQLEISPDFNRTRAPRFLRCYFAVIDGLTSRRDLPDDVFDAECVADSFENAAETTNAILELSLPLGTKVLLTLLRKLYAQRGRGRRESALYRGLDLRGRQLVPEALALLRKEGLIVRNGQADQAVWLPTKLSTARRRVLSILSAPTSSQDGLMAASKNLG